jgi:pyruvate dehydrogenase E1 component alpha subunit
VQTTADTTELQDKPHDLSQPITLKLHEESFRSYNCEAPNLEVQLTKNELLTMYKEMQTMRRMEMAADALYKAKLIRGFCHLAIGQVRRLGYMCNMRPQLQFLFSFDRKQCRLDSNTVSKKMTASLPPIVAIPLLLCVVELSRVSLVNFSGVNAECHMAKVVQCISIGAGISFAQKYRGEKHCTFALYGDGASNQGQVFEAFNMVRR